LDLATATGNIAPKRAIDDVFNEPTGIDGDAYLWGRQWGTLVASEEDASVRVFEILPS